MQKVTSGLPKPITFLQNFISDANAKEQVRITRGDCRHKKQFPALQMICKLFLFPLLGQDSQASKPLGSASLKTTPSSGHVLSIRFWFRCHEHNFQYCSALQSLTVGTDYATTFKVNFIISLPDMIRVFSFKLTLYNYLLLLLIVQILWCLQQKKMKLPSAWQ